MHDAFEHAVVIEKLPLQIECIATFGKKSRTLNEKATNGHFHLATGPLIRVWYSSLIGILHVFKIRFINFLKVNYCLTVEYPVTR